ncbi:hypothetical protein LEL_08648 [Akanthomyces lecanii RCEF 1005]|uniref:MARVEL-like domain protein n=1 Tax=Akanthomyces lecanii RCEF 1005 TaxID=1081108 RepID=A0A162LMK9_CORDF|nr:hypothetical protein LEL_08648 [Akanthomyces lecanii RCEF 1005]
MPPSLPPHAELVRRVLLGVEVCIVLLATIHSAHATITAGRLQSLQCAVHGDCATEPPQGEEVVSLLSSGLALAILSDVVLLARLALLQLRYFPRFVGLLYDLLMAVLWILGLAHLVLARGAAGTARNLSNGGGLVDTDGDSVVVDCWRLRGVAVSTAAALFYGGRLLWELFAIFAHSGAPTTTEYRSIQQDEWEEEDREKGRGVAVVHAPQAYSPVLAFFPDDGY